MKAETKHGSYFVIACFFPKKVEANFETLYGQFLIAMGLVMPIKIDNGTQGRIHVTMPLPILTYWLKELPRIPGQGLRRCTMFRDFLDLNRKNIVHVFDQAEYQVSDGRTAEL
jgi:hypothetical protein